MRNTLLIIALIIEATGLFAQNDRLVLDIVLSNYEYPFEVRYLDLKNQGQELKMAYMDVHPEKPNGKTVVLLHGKNFNGAYSVGSVRIFKY